VDAVFDVAIGYGPAGGAAAALLGQAGLRVHVCDRLRDVYEIPRANSIDHGIMRVLQQIGLVDAIEAVFRALHAVRVFRRRRATDLPHDDGRPALPAGMDAVGRRQPARQQRPGALGRGGLPRVLAGLERDRPAPVVAGAERLLDSYGAEHQAHVRVLMRRIKAIGAVICERDPARARERDARLLAECGGGVKDTPRQDVLPRLEAGLLAAADHGARGTLFPQPRLSGDELMDDRCGRGWRLVVDATGSAPAALPGLTVIAIGEPDTAETDGVAAAWMQRHQVHAALVRPDHCVYGAAATPAALQ
jgi:hypothetical protein